MTWEEKLAACAALGPDPCLMMRQPGNWYVSQAGIDIRDPNLITGRYGNGKTPEEAAEAHFKVLTTYGELEWLEVRHVGTTRSLRWNGFMWKDYFAKAEPKGK